MELYRIANKLFRDRNYLEAALLYDYLYRRNPEFYLYNQSLSNALKKIDKRLDGRRLKLKPNGVSDSNHELLVLGKAIIALNGGDKKFLNEALEKLSGHKEVDLLKASLSCKSDLSIWVSCVNNWLSQFGMRGIHLDNSQKNTNILNKVKFLGSNACHGDLVTIFMSAYNSEETIEYAIRSVVEQDYKDLEIIIIDDNSNDATLEIVSDFAGGDSRIKFYKNEKNKGTYYNRNVGLSLSKGKYFTVMDADDLAHPERVKLQYDAIKLSSYQSCVADWVRVKRTGDFFLKNMGCGGYQHEAVATLFFDKDILVSKIGYYDMVRFGADSEYFSRIKKTFGESSIHKLLKPVCFSLFDECSLTGNSELGVDPFYGSSRVRIKYRDSWKAWHANADCLYMPCNDVRFFEAPLEML